jgi:phage terminase Nu1 subunit (DNA packaging protein)
MNISNSLEIRRVNRVDLARFFGTTVAEVDKWVELGAPYVKRAARKGDAWEFDTADVANWRIEMVRLRRLPPLRHR